MYRKWKNTAALGLTVLLGCMMPVCTMLAAENDVETEADSVSDNDVFHEDVSLLTAAVAEPDAQMQDADRSDVVNAPEIVITRDGKNRACSLGGEITFEYIRYWGPQFDVTVGQSDQEVSLFCCLDRVTDTEAGAKNEDQMDSLYWGEKQTPPVTLQPLNDGIYVVYVKAEAGGQTYYARSDGIVVDTQRPVIKGIEEGETYPEGTLFQVEDANLDRVLVNEEPALSEDGNYKVVANGTSCVIRAIDKAGNETSCSVNVSGNEMPEPDNIISESGVYELKAGKKYYLAEGKWKVEGDGSVYQGGNEFYVKADGSYKFSK